MLQPRAGQEGCSGPPGNCGVPEGENETGRQGPGGQQRLSEIPQARGRAGGLQHRRRQASGGSPLRRAVGIANQHQPVDRGGGLSVQAVVDGRAGLPGREERTGDTPDLPQM